MKVSLDGGITYRDVDCHGVRIIYDVKDVIGNTELHINLTPEAIIRDMWQGRTNLATDWETINDVVESMYQDKFDV